MSSYQRYNQAQRMRIWTCEIMCGDDGVSYSLEVVPILARNPEHAALLMWKEHHDFLCENIPELSIKPSDARAPEVLVGHPKVTFKECKCGGDIWAKADFISDQIVTRAM